MLPELGTLGIWVYSSLVLSPSSLAVSSLVSPTLRPLRSLGTAPAPYTWWRVLSGGPETLRRPAGARESACR